MAVGVDVRLNAGGGVKFQPDVIVWNAQGEIVLAVDFESPNSIDARVPRKDAEPYLRWSDDIVHPFPSIVVTSLPRGPVARTDWEVRWLHPDQVNHDHRERQDAIRASPFDYWYAFYREEVDRLIREEGASAWRRRPLYFVNLFGVHPEIVERPPYRALAPASR